MATMNKSNNAIIDDANKVAGDIFTKRAKNIIDNKVNSVKKNVINSDLIKFMIVSPLIFFCRLPCIQDKDKALSCLPLE